MDHQSSALSPSSTLLADCIIGEESGGELLYSSKITDKILQSQLNWCYEVIKLLERQRYIYRAYSSQCKCHRVSEPQELKSLDDEIENIYRRPEAKLLRELTINSRKRFGNLSSQGQ